MKLSEVPEYPLITLTDGQEGYEKRKDGEYQALTYTSGGKRKYNENQDSAYANADKGVVAVVDGVGGHAGGRNASTAAVTAINDGVIDGISTDEILGTAHARINELPQTDPAVTLAIARTLLSEGQYFIECINIGDSKIYIIHPQKGLLHESRDQSKYEYMRAQYSYLHPLNRYTYELNHLVTNFLAKGMKIKPAEKAFIGVERGVYVLAVTDGITDFVSSEEIVELIQKHGKDAPMKIKELAESRQWQEKGFDIKLDGQMWHAYSKTTNHGDNIGLAMMIVGGEHPAESAPTHFVQNPSAEPTVTGDAVGRRVEQALKRGYRRADALTIDRLKANVESTYIADKRTIVQFGVDPNLYIVITKDNGGLKLDLTPVGGQTIFLNLGDTIELGRDNLGGNRKISKQHVKIKYTNEQKVTIMDLGSLNGTSVLQ